MDGGVYLGNYLVLLAAWYRRHHQCFMSNFFAGGTAGIFGNAIDGKRGAIIGGILHGIFIMILPALLSPMLAQIGFVNMTCTDVDTVVTGFFFMAIKSILGLFGIA